MRELVFVALGLFWVLAFGAVGVISAHTMTNLILFLAVAPLLLVAVAVLAPLAARELFKDRFRRL